ncbi:hypothetical protein DM02DRAFT_412361 [Periconia macrospinosa]|uniref:Uncharacterized protein n=1 Tax=Periconia macrospinosa TaxID=97972 RepID=A0A2V1DPA7_9PLEO|nr:hypothetical protein DM02DRAFT_412361 [Periconia macrospinosa]
MKPVQRKIGWKWQVKVVQLETETELSESRLLLEQKIAKIEMVGLSSSFNNGVGSRHYMRGTLVNALIGLSVAVWVWNRLQFSYHFAMALAVGVGWTDKDEWPRS